MDELSWHKFWMKRAIDLAKLAGNRGEIPVGAIIVDHNNNLVATGVNQKELRQDATAHAEIIAIQTASQKLGNWHLTKCTLYVTLEPCPMCAGAIIQARLKTLVYGADDWKTGAIRSVLNLPDSNASNHQLQVFAGIEQTSCRQLLHSWFHHQRINNHGV